MSDGPKIWEVGEDIIIDLAVVNPNDGLGLLDQQSFIELVIQRLSDNKFWNTSAWVTTRTTLTMSQADRTNQPGRYTFTLPGTGGNIQADRYLAFSEIANAPTVEGQTFEIHVSRTTSVRIYESEPSLR